MNNNSTKTTPDTNYRPRLPLQYDYDNGDENDGSHLSQKYDHVMFESYS